MLQQGCDRTELQWALDVRGSRRMVSGWSGTIPAAGLPRRIKYLRQNICVACGSARAMWLQNYSICQSLRRLMLGFGAVPRAHWREHVRHPRRRRGLETVCHSVKGTVRLRVRWQ